MISSTDRIYRTGYRTGPDASATLVAGSNRRRNAMAHEHRRLMHRTSLAHQMQSDKCAPFAWTLHPGNSTAFHHVAECQPWHNSQILQTSSCKRKRTFTD